MLIDVVTSDDFEHGLSQLPLSMREIVIKKVRLLAENPAHPSLNTHRVKLVKGHIWECYITESMRLLYEVKEKCLYLWELGSHAIVDNVRLRGFAANTRFNRRDDIYRTLFPSLYNRLDKRNHTSMLSTGKLPFLWTQ